MSLFICLHADIHLAAQIFDVFCYQSSRKKLESNVLETLIFFPLGTWLLATLASMFAFLASSCT